MPGSSVTRRGRARVKAFYTWGEDDPRDRVIEVLLDNEPISLAFLGTPHKEDWEQWGDPSMFYVGRVRNIEFSVKQARLLHRLLGVALKEVPRPCPWTGVQRQTMKTIEGLDALFALRGEE